MTPYLNGGLGILIFAPLLHLKPIIFKKYPNVNDFLKGLKIYNYYAI
jgi:hypothetical protein